MPARTPTALKALSGTLRRDRLNPREPKVSAAIPRPSRQLAADERREFGKLARRLEPMRVLTAGDVFALELAATALAEFWRLRRVVHAAGDVYETATAQGSTMIRQRPEVAMAADAWRRAATMLQRLGLDPVSRARVEGIEPILPAAPRWAGPPEKTPARYFTGG